jgi:hypothetical protein
LTGLQREEIKWLEWLYKKLEIKAVIWFKGTPTSRERFAQEVKP